MYSLYDTWGFPCVFPHSEISGSLAMCAYPKLIAAYHVLHRLLMPRHSPCALCSLTYSVKIFKVLHLISQRIFLGLLLNMFWSYILFMCNFQRTIKFAINFALLCRLRRCAAHLSNKFRYSLLVSKYCSFLSNFEKHGFSKLNRLVKPVIF